ncbi:hypothetical protein KSP40_PGU003861 [Platanthera guangdongensis]|uniref:Leucine-rich repeat-containing N-terminal plant-type domain-containing protein n=1 Tax=Platanthera guangdongensis TaxID=2320717 RepID=A0ABR2MX03_9ASPA
MAASFAPFLLFFLYSTSARSSPSLAPGDLQALLDIRQSLFDLPGSTFFSTWNFFLDPCASFTGVTCSSDDSNFNFLRVSVLTLGTGLTDSPGLGGTLPHSISNLTALTLLSISSNRFLGPIPTSLSNLPFLHTLDLSQNQLQGPIHSSLLSSNPSLKVLLLAYNGGLFGSIPSELTSASNLLHLDLRGNSFTGSLPPLPATLRFLSASLNSLSGLLVDLSYNAFSGAFPLSILALPLLSSIFLSHNNFSGDVSLPFSSEPMPRWAVVDVSYNMLTGELPAGLAASATLYLNGNRFTGAVPEEYIASVHNGSMNTLYAQDNYLTVFSRPVAAGMAVPAMASLCLSHNCMVPPAEATSGCPSSVQAQLPRPAYQCRATAGEIIFENGSRVGFLYRVGTTLVHEAEK